MNETNGQSEEAEPQIAELTPCRKNRILIVDDEQSVRDVFSRVVAFHLPNCRVDLAVNGAEAVSSFRDVHHGIIIMDARMPVMDGEAAFAAIRELCNVENWVMPSVIFCTGFDPSHEVRNIVAANPAHCVLRKPLDSTILMEAIRARLAR